VPLGLELGWASCYGGWVSPKLKPKADKASLPSRTPSSSASGSRTSDSAPPTDAVLIQGISEDGSTLAVLRAREDRIEAGLVRAVKEGEPVQGELIKLTPRPDSPLVCDVEVQVPAGAINARGGSDEASTQGTRGRPAQVATDTYRENWDAIWSKPSAGKKALSN
jgi:hypothetical protein